MQLASVLHVPIPVIILFMSTKLQLESSFFQAIFHAASGKIRSLYHVARMICHSVPEKIGNTDRSTKLSLQVATATICSAGIDPC